MNPENEQKTVDETIEDAPVEEAEVEEEQTEAEEVEPEQTEEEESTLAEDALSEIDEVEDDPKDAVIGGFRKQLRESEIQVAELRGRIEELKPKEPEPKKEVVKSPMDLALEKAAEEQGVDVDEAELVVTGKLHREQQDFDRNQRQQQQETTTKEQSDDLASKAFVKAGITMNVEAMGKGLGFKDIMSQIEGKGLVTAADMTWLASKSDGMDGFYEKLYDFSKKAILSAGGEAAEILQANITAHSQDNEKKLKKLPEKKKVLTREKIIAEATSVTDAHLINIMNA